MHEEKNNPPDEKPTGETSPVRKLFSILLMTSGVLIFVTVGICTISVVNINFLQSNGGVLLVALFAGVPVLVGIALIKWAQLLRKSDDSPRE